MAAGGTPTVDSGGGTRSLGVGFVGFGSSETEPLSGDEADWVSVYNNRTSINFICCAAKLTNQIFARKLK